MLLADQLKELCAAHDLTSISVSFHDFRDIPGQPQFTAYVHWKQASGQCASAHDVQPEMAIAKAVAEADAIRGRGVLAIEPVEMAA